MMSVNSCPDCDKPLDLLKLGSEPIREVCGRFDCDFDGRTVSKEEAISLAA